MGNEPEDLAIGSFSSEAPWIIDPDAIPWRRAVPGLRREIARRLPELTRPRRLPPGVRVVRTVAAIGGALAAWAAGARRQGGSASVADLSRRLRLAAEALGPTYIKLGQIISSGEGIFPAELVAEFRKCRDQVPPEPFTAVRGVVEEDLGQPLEAVFARFEPVPLASASIAQVHLATLQSGEEVVVKVQRSSVADRVHRDLEVMAWIAPFTVGRIPVAALANPPALVELFAETITEELDFRIEAENMLEVARAFAELDQRKYVVPRPHPTLVTPRVLVMERLSGFAFDDVAGMQGAGVDTEEVVRAGMIGFMEGALIHGVFHGDLHGGNLFVLPDGRTALLDFGIVGRLSQPRRLAFLRLLLSATSNDVMGQLASLRDLGALPPDTDLEAVVRDLGLDRPVVDPTTLDADQLVAEMQRTVKALLGIGARLPKELMLFIKNLVFLDGAIATLAPDLDIIGEIGNVSMHFATAHGERLAAELGMDPADYQLDLTGVRASFGLDEDTGGPVTYRDLQRRREVIRSRLQRRPR
ncbi:MAG TPA: AarF/UbiB family protein [Acidimicrobiales bacterium]|nr:AarF/UbiB family protein [Acidimicrobiales bacterium]